VTRRTKPRKFGEEGGGREEISKKNKMLSGMRGRAFNWIEGWEVIHER
jgi:hypothetical protein